MTLLQNGAGVLWLATSGGLEKFDPASGTFTHYWSDPKDAASISADEVKFVAEDSAGTFAVASTAGPDAFDRSRRSDGSRYSYRKVVHDETADERLNTTRE